eukprot:jgi/Chlat1/2955/Chrsp2S04688
MVRQTAGALHAALLVLAALLHTACADTVSVSTASQLLKELADPAATEIVVTVDRAVTLRGASTLRGRVQLSGTGVLIQVGSQGTLAAAGLSISKASGSPVVVEGQATFTDCEFLGNFAGANGGAISSTGTLTLQGCLFVNNTANTTTFYGGAVASSRTLTVVDCTFEGNTASTAGAVAVLSGNASIIGSNFTGNTAPNDAGAISNAGSLVLNQTFFAANGASYTGGTIRTDGVLIVDSCTFENNGDLNTYGGVLFSSFSSTVTLSNSAFDGNFALNGGTIYNAGDLTATSCNITNSQAPGGAALFVSSQGGTAMKLIDCRITDSIAPNDGGGMQLEDGNGGSAAVSLSGCFFERNQAQIGAGGAIFNHAVFNLTIDSSTFVDNSAYTSGGAIHNAVRATITSSTFKRNSVQTQNGGAITNLLVLDVRNSTFADNAALGGAGIWNSGTDASLQGLSYTVRAFVDGNLARVTNCRFLRNQATNAGGGILHGAGNLIVSGSYFQDNTAATLGGGGLYAGGYETYKFCRRGETLIQDSKFVSNDAIYGGGAFVQGEACVYTANVTFAQCTFTNNRALQGAGGAIYSGLPPNITCPSSTVSDSSSGCESWANNTAQGGGYGDVVATPPVVLRTPTELYSSQASRQPLANFAASLYDGFGTMVKGLQYDGKVVSLSIANGTGQLQGAVTSAFFKGVANFSGVNVDDTPGANVIRLSVSSFTSSPISSSAPPPVVVSSEGTVVVDIRPCVAGEVRSEDNRTCSVCAIPRFSWNPNNVTCDDCPEHAICQSGARVAPEDGYWHSSQQSFVFHQCPNTGACIYNNRSGTIDAAIIYDNYTTDLQCSEGYSGNLCGVCTEAFGVSGFPGDFVCRRCPGKGWMAMYFILWVLFQIGLVAGLIFLHLAANAPSALRQDRTRLNGAARLKIVIHFFQVVSLAYYIQYQWPLFVQYLFATTGTLSLFQSLLIPLECFVQREPGATLSPAYQINIFYAVLPFIAFAPSLVFWPLRYRAYVARRNALASRGNSAANVIEAAGADVDLERKHEKQHSNNGVLAHERASEDLNLAHEPHMDTAAHWEGQPPAGFLASSRPSNVVDADNLWPAAAPDGTPPEALVTLRVPAPHYENDIMPGRFAAGHMSRSSTAAVTAGMDQQPTLKFGQYLRQRYALSAACTALLIWPSVVSNIVSIFACRRVDHDISSDRYYQNAIAQGYYWQQDLNEQCFAGTHLKHVLIIGVPGLLFYCLLIPGGVILWLWHKKRSLNKAHVVGALGVLYQQYRPTWFFWDGVLLLQKYLLIINSILLDKFGAQLQISIAFAIILASVTIQWHSYYTATATVWFGMVYFLGLSSGVSTLVSVLLGVFCLVPAVLLSLTVMTGRLQDHRKLSPHRDHIKDTNNVSEGKTAKA